MAVTDFTILYIYYSFPFMGDDDALQSIESYMHISTYIRIYIIHYMHTF